MGFAKADHLPGDLQEDPMIKMARTVLPFKLAATEEPMTAQSWLWSGTACSALRIDADRGWTLSGRFTDDP